MLRWVEREGGGWVFSGRLSVFVYPGTNHARDTQTTAVRPKLRQMARMFCSPLQRGRYPYCNTEYPENSVLSLRSPKLHESVPIMRGTVVPAQALLRLRASLLAWRKTLAGYRRLHLIYDVNRVSFRKPQ